MAVTVTNQAELDAAIAAAEPDIWIKSPAGLWLAVTACNLSTVHACDSSTVHACDSSTVTACDSATVRAYDSSTVRACDSATVRAYESSTVRAYDWSTVHAYGSATVTAAKLVAVHKLVDGPKIKGGVVLDHTTVDDTDIAQWVDHHGGTWVGRGKRRLRLYKATGPEFQAGEKYRLTHYVPGTEVVADDWAPGGFCGGGLHLGPTPGHALAYRRDATRFVEVEVDVADVIPITDGGMTAKVKARRCKVIREVDIAGSPIEAGDISRRGI